MAASRRRRVLGVIVVLGLGFGAGATALTLLGRDGDDDRQQSDRPDLVTTPVEQRPLAEYLEVAGTLDYASAVTLTAQTSGVLTHLEPEGAVVAQ
ncbi:MAG: hypothetical protein OXC00_13405, partial [Acidimicrobiaceae bacterium]|nr:hypothetical protein [Acidimicrobiaceae bacterium]